MREPINYVPCSTLQDDTRACKQINRNRTPMRERRPDGVLYCGHVLTVHGELYNVKRRRFVQYRPMDSTGESPMVAALYTGEGVREFGAREYWRYKYREVQNGQG